MAPSAKSSQKESKKSAPVAEQPWVSEASALFSVGHQPQVTLSAEQQELFKSFQSNLISLLSHELRTPLMGILNALSALDESGEPLGGLSLAEALTMAREQSQKLDAALSTVLDLAAWEAGNLQVDLREGDFEVLVASVFGSELQVSSSGAWKQGRLLDASRLKRALVRLRDLLGSLGRIQKSTVMPSGTLELECQLQDSASIEFWERLWHEAQVARAAHASLPLHVFAGVLQTQEGFLSRTREGLGAELHLVAQILSQHEAKFEALRTDSQLSIRIALPEIEGRARVLKLIQGRIWRPGVSEPSAVELRLSTEAGAGRYWIEGKRWLEIGSGSPPLAGQVIRCPQDGVDASVLLDLVLAT